MNAILRKWEPSTVGSRIFFFNNFIRCEVSQAGRGYSTEMSLWILLSSVDFPDLASVFGIMASTSKYCTLRNTAVLLLPGHVISLPQYLHCNIYHNFKLVIFHPALTQEHRCTKAVLDTLKRLSLFDMKGYSSCYARESGSDE